MKNISSTRSNCDFASHMAAIWWLLTSNVYLIETITSRHLVLKSLFGTFSQIHLQYVSLAPWLWMPMWTSFFGLLTLVLPLELLVLLFLPTRALWLVVFFCFLIFLTLSLPHLFYHQICLTCLNFPTESIAFFHRQELWALDLNTDVIFWLYDFAF